MYKLFLCLRYLQKKRIALCGVISVMLCVALLIVVNSLFYGFINSYLKYTQQIWGQIVFTPGLPLDDYAGLADSFETIPAIRTAAPLIKTGALLYLKTGDVRAVELLGINLEKQCRDTGFRQGLLIQNESNRIPSFNLPKTATEKALAWTRQRHIDARPAGAIVGIGLWQEPNEQTDEFDIPAILRHIKTRKTPMIVTTGQKPDNNRTVALQKSTGFCWPVDVIQTGFYEADSSYVYVPFDFLKNLLNSPDENGRTNCLAQIQITTKIGFNEDLALEQLHRHWRTYAHNTLHWSRDSIPSAHFIVTRKNPSLRMFLEEIRKQLWILQLILSLICVVVALLIFVILFMIVMNKKRDIGIIRSLGASRAAVAAIFLSYGAAIGAVGAGLGLILGILATWNIDHLEDLLTKLLGFKIWKSGVYMFRQIPNEVAWHTVKWILLAGLIAAILGALLPAIRSARLQPVESLRYE